jgi:dTDP-4-amino-4,6-dideoxygalactose transaminase
LRDHGAAMSDLQRHLGAKPYLLADHPDAGYNQRMTDLQAALGNAQMDRARDLITERQRLAARYDQAFAGLDWLQTPTKRQGDAHGYQSYPCLFQPKRARAAVHSANTSEIKAINAARNSWMEQLQQQGISTRPATHAVHMLAYYRKKYQLKPEDFPNAFVANDCSISLPLFHGMTEAEQDFVIERVRENAN